MGPIGHERHDRRANGGEEGRTEHDALPLESHTADEVGSGAADGERADEHSEGHAAGLVEPPGHHLQSAGVHAGERRARDRPQSDGDRVLATVERHQQRIRSSADGGGDEEDPPTVVAVGDPADRQAECAHYEAQLHRKREAGGLARGEVPHLLQLWGDRRGGEPQREREELCGGDRNERPADRD